MLYTIGKHASLVFRKSVLTTPKNNVYFERVIALQSRGLWLVRAFIRLVLKVSKSKI